MPAIGQRWHACRKRVRLSEQCFTISGDSLKKKGVWLSTGVVLCAAFRFPVCTAHCSPCRPNKRTCACSTQRMRSHSGVLSFTTGPTTGAPHEGRHPHLSSLNGAKTSDVANSKWPVPTSPHYEESALDKWCRTCGRGNHCRHFIDLALRAAKLSAQVQKTLLQVVP